MKKLDNLVGVRFGKLVVQERGPRNVKDQNRAMWYCLCDCGSITLVGQNSLKNKNTKSCGCFRYDHAKKHGHTRRGWKSTEYNSWADMKDRCYNPNNIRFKHYGGRGITVCQIWKDSFEAFIRDMGAKPKRHTLERRDVNGNYSPDNCCWATFSEQNKNRRPFTWSVEGKKRHFRNVSKQK